MPDSATAWWFCSQEQPEQRTCALLAVVLACSLGGSWFSQHGQEIEQSDGVVLLLKHHLLIVVYGLLRAGNLHTDHATQPAPLHCCAGMHVRAHTPCCAPAPSCTPCQHTLPALTLSCMPCSRPSTCSIRARFEKVIREAQDSICAAISEIDGKPFHQDAWTREDGGGGITRVLTVSDSCLLYFVRSSMCSMCSG